MNLRVQTLQVRTANEFDSAFQALLRERADALIISPRPLFITFEARIAFATQNGLPSISQSSPYVDAGGLMSYGTEFGFNFRRAAHLVDKI